MKPTKFNFIILSVGFLLSAGCIQQPQNKAKVQEDSDLVYERGDGQNGHLNGEEENQGPPQNEGNRRRRPPPERLTQEQIEKLGNLEELWDVEEFMASQKESQCVFVIENDYIAIYGSTKTLRIELDPYLNFIDEVKNHMAFMENYIQTQCELPPPEEDRLIEHPEGDRPPPPQCLPPKDLEYGMSHILGRWMKLDGEKRYFPCQIKQTEVGSILEFQRGHIELLKTNGACVSHLQVDGIQFICDDLSESFLPRPSDTSESL